MSGDAFFASFTGRAPGWARAFRQPHGQATARTVAAVPDLVRTAWGQAQAGASGASIPYASGCRPN